MDRVEVSRFRRVWLCGDVIEARMLSRELPVIMRLNFCDVGLWWWFIRTGHSTPPNPSMALEPSAPKPLGLQR